MLMFFFSSRRRHTRCGRDWSSDVCSSDLAKRYFFAGHDTVRAIDRKPAVSRGNVRRAGAADPPTGSYAAAASESRNTWGFPGRLPESTGKETGEPLRVGARNGG